MLTPLGNNLFVEPMRRQLSAGGIQLLDDRVYAGDTMEYLVLTVGPGRRLKCGQVKPIWPDIKPGDLIVAGVHSAKAFELEGHTVYVMDAGEALMTINTEPEDEPLGTIENFPVDKPPPPVELVSP
jgi:co-chaperonin GroES (HSP10)